MVYFNAKKWSSRKLFKQLIKLIFIRTREKSDFYQWLREDLIGVFQDKVWGVPLPIFINKTKEPLKDQKVIDRIAKFMRDRFRLLVYRRFSVFWGDEYNAKDYEKLNDIVEVWFDSGSTHSFVLEKEKI